MNYLPYAEPQDLVPFQPMPAFPEAQAETPKLPPKPQSSSVAGIAAYEALIHTFWLIYLIVLMWNHDSTKSDIKSLQERIKSLEQKVEEQEASAQAWQEKYKADCEQWEEYKRAWQEQWKAQNAEYIKAFSKMIEGLQNKEVSPAPAPAPTAPLPRPARVITFDIGEILSAHLKKTLGAVQCRMEYTLVPEDLPASTKVPEMVWEKSPKVNTGNICSLLVPVGMKCYLKSIWINVLGAPNDYYTDLFQKFFDR